ncbi:MAG: tetratricopeptide repeat protein [Candidatus Cloacimonetes bacterium]|nr:tetratricopeptide repeat protein [Candidatus Cloacimonadota bacterium]
MDKIDLLEKEMSLAQGAKKIDLRLDLAFLLRMKDPPASLEHALTAYEEAKTAGEEKLELRALQQICTSALYNKEFQDADIWIDKLAERGIELNHNASIGRSYIMKYRWSVREGKLSTAAEYLTNALKFLDPAQNLSDVATCYNGLGNIYYELKDHQKALKYYNQAMPLVKNLNSNAYFTVRQNIGIIHLMIHEYDQAWEIYHNLLDELPADDIGARRLVLLNLSHICHKVTEFDQALVYIDQVIKLSEGQLPTHNLIRPFCNKGLILIDLEDYKAALKYIQKAETIALDSENQADLMEVYHAMVAFYKKFGELEKLVDYHEKLFEVMQKLLNTEQLSEINKFESRHQINLYRDQNEILEDRNKLIAEQNKFLKESMKILLDKDTATKIQLKNAFKSKGLKENQLTGQQPLASINDKTADIVQQWKQPLNMIKSLVFSIKEAYNLNELTEDSIDHKTKIIDDLIQYLTKTINDFSEFFKE